MSATKMTPLQIFSGDEELSRIEAQDIMRVLLVEDEKDLREGIVQRLSECGYSVDAFATPRDAAARLRPNEYQLAIMDIRFDAPNISGDEFIYKNADCFANTRVVAFTGHEDDIVYEDVFDEIFLKKFSRDDLYHFAENTYRDRQKEIATEMKNKIISADKLAGEPEMRARSRDELIRVLKETKDRDTKLVWYKGRDFSANELLTEVEDESSPVGKSHIRMMADWLLRRRSQ